MEGITHRDTDIQEFNHILYFYNSLMQELTAPTNQRDKMKEQISFRSMQTTLIYCIKIHEATPRLCKP
jgi:hypothetical protein